MTFQEGVLAPNASGGSPAPMVPWGIADLLKAIGLLVVAFFVVLIPAATIAGRIAGSVDKIDDDPEALAFMLAVNMGIDVLMLLVALRFSVRKYSCSLAALGLRAPQRGGLWLAFPVLMGAYAILAVYFGLVELGNVDSLQPDSTLPDSTFDSLLVSITASVLVIGFAPLIEEIFFRGFLFSAIRSHWGVILGAMISGLIFSSLHADMGSVIPFSLIGALFAFAYAYSGSLLPSIGAHLAFNTISMVASIAGAAD